MALKKISALPALTGLPSATDTLPIVATGITKQVPIGSLSGRRLVKSVSTSTALVLADWAGHDPSQSELVVSVTGTGTIMITLPTDGALVAGARVRIVKASTQSNSCSLAGANLQNDSLGNVTMSNYELWSTDTAPALSFAFTYTGAAWAADGPVRRFNFLNPQAINVSAFSVVGRAATGSGSAGNIALAANGLLGRGSGDITSINISTNALVGRGGGALGQIGISTQTVLGRASGDLGPIAVGTNQLVGRSGGDLTSLTVGTNEVVARGSGDLGTVGVADNSVLARIGAGALTSLTPGTNSVLGRSGADLTAMSMLNYSVLARPGTGNTFALDFTDNSALIRSGSNNVTATVAAEGEILGRPTGGSLDFLPLSSFGIASGTYTPTISNESNCTVTLTAAWYQRVGSIVTVSARGQYTATAAGNKTWRLTCPVTTAFTAANQAGGAVTVYSASVVYAGIVQSVASSSTISVTSAVDATTSGAKNWHITYHYEVL